MFEPIRNSIVARTKLTLLAVWTPLALVALLCVSCTPRYDQDFDTFQRGRTRTTQGAGSTTLPSSGTTLPQRTGERTTLPVRSGTTLPARSGTTLPGRSGTTLPRSPR